MLDFQTLYQQKVGLIYRYVYSKVGNRDEAEDLTAEIFLKAMSGINLERSPESMQSWLYLIARTTIADYWRAYYHLPQSSLDSLLETGWEGPAEKEAVDFNDTPATCVQHLLSALPAQYREVLICRFLLNLSVKETALKMAVTESNVRVLQYRALKRAAILENAAMPEESEVVCSS